MAPREVVRLVDAQAARRDRIRDALSEAITRLVASWSDFSTPGEVARLVAALLKLVEPAQASTASTTDAYLARVIGELRGRPSSPVGVRVDPSRLRGGVEHREVWQRVAKEYRYHVSRGLDEDQARQRAARRARVIGFEDLDLANREAARQVFTRTPGVTGYRRVIHPELSREGVCGLCVAASDRTYSTGDLMPIHALCKCEPLPIIGTQDPGRSLNADELAELYEQAGSTNADKLKRVRYVVREHGELGPVLRESDEHFRGPDEVAELEAA